MKKENIILIVVSLLIIVLLAFSFITKPESVITKITLEEFYKKIENEDSFLLYVARTGCPSCQKFEPVYTSALKTSNTKSYKVDLDFETKEDATKFYTLYSIAGTPNVLVFKDGKDGLLYNRLNGNSYTKEEMIKFLNKNK